MGPTPFFYSNKFNLVQYNVRITPCSEQLN